MSTGVPASAEAVPSPGSAAAGTMQQKSRQRGTAPRTQAVVPPSSSTPSFFSPGAALLDKIAAESDPLQALAAAVGFVDSAVGALYRRAQGQGKGAPHASSAASSPLPGRRLSNNPDERAAAQLVSVVKQFASTLSRDPQWDSCMQTLARRAAEVAYKGTQGQLPSPFPSPVPLIRAASHLQLFALSGSESTSQAAVALADALPRLLPRHPRHPTDGPAAAAVLLPPIIRATRQALDVASLCADVEREGNAGNAGGEERKGKKVTAPSAASRVPPFLPPVLSFVFASVSELAGTRGGGGGGGGIGGQLGAVEEVLRAVVAAPIGGPAAVPPAEEQRVLSNLVADTRAMLVLLKRLGYAYDGRGRRGESTGNPSSINPTPTPKAIPSSCEAGFALLAAAGVRDASHHSTFINALGIVSHSAALLPSQEAGKGAGAAAAPATAMAVAAYRAVAEAIGESGILPSSARRRHTLSPRDLPPVHAASLASFLSAISSRLLLADGSRKKGSELIVASLLFPLALVAAAATPTSSWSPAAAASVAETLTAIRRETGVLPPALFLAALSNAVGHLLRDGSKAESGRLFSSRGLAAVARCFALCRGRDVGLLEGIAAHIAPSEADSHLILSGRKHSFHGGAAAFPIGDLATLLHSFASLGVRPPPELLDEVEGKVMAAAAAEGRQGAEARRSEASLGSTIALLWSVTTTGLAAERGDLVAALVRRLPSDLLSSPRLRLTRAQVAMLRTASAVIAARNAEIAALGGVASQQQQTLLPRFPPTVDAAIRIGAGRAGDDKDEKEEEEGGEDGEDDSDASDALSAEEVTAHAVSPAASVFPPGTTTTTRVRLEVLASVHRWLLRRARGKGETVREGEGDGSSFSLFLNAKHAASFNTLDALLVPSSPPSAADGDAAPPASRRRPAIAVLILGPGKFLPPVLDSSALIASAAAAAAKGEGDAGVEASFRSDALEAVSGSIRPHTVARVYALKLLDPTLSLVTVRHTLPAELGLSPMTTMRTSTARQGKGDLFGYLPPSNAKDGAAFSAQRVEEIRAAVDGWLFPQLDAAAAAAAGVAMR